MKKRGRGAPKNNQNASKSDSSKAFNNVIPVRLNDEQVGLINDAAEMDGKKPSAYIRESVVRAAKRKTKKG